MGMRKLGLLAGLACASAYTALDASALGAGADPVSCVSLSGTDAEDKWCSVGCVNTPPNCPSTICKCDGDLPTPSPLAGADVVGAAGPELADDRPITKVEEEAAARVAAANKEREDADAARADAEESKLKEEQDRIERAEEQRTTLENAAAGAVASLQPKASPSPAPEQDGDDHEVRTAGSVGSKYVSALVSGGDPKSCKAIGGALADNNWCATSCSNNPPNCPSTICKCADGGAPALINAEASPSPAPSARKMTKEEKAAQKASEAREAMAVAAEAERAKAEAKKLGDQEKRIADDEQRVVDSESDRKRVEKVQRAAEPSPAPAAAKGKASKKSASSKVASKAAAAHSNKNAIKRTGIKEASALESQASALAGGADPTTCVAVDTMVADSWCVQSCGAEPPNCPPGTCKCDGPNPSPSPVPGVAAPEADDAAAPADVDERGQTKAEAAAAKAAEDRDTAVAEADEAREAAEAARAEEDAKRVAEVEAGREAATAGTAADADAEAPVPSPLVAPEVPDVPDVPLPVAPEVPPVPPVPEFPKPLEAPKDADPRELTDAEVSPNPNPNPNPQPLTLNPTFTLTLALTLTLTLTLTRRRRPRRRRRRTTSWPRPTVSARTPRPNACR